jgi:hypothetical protein
MTQNWPLVSHFPMARDVALSPESAWVDSPAPQTLAIAAAERRRAVLEGLESGLRGL